MHKCILLTFSALRNMKKQSTKNSNENGIENTSVRRESKLSVFFAHNCKIQTDNCQDNCTIDGLRLTRRRKR